MNGTSRLALLLALLLPFLGYFIVDHFSKDAVHMPLHYFYDSVQVITKRGKSTNDTIWHQVRDIHFVNQLGRRVSLHEVKGRPIVMDFFFTRCPSICPGLARSMEKLQDAYKQNPDYVQFISVSVDPQNDSVPQLRKFADRFHANHDNWWFVTGDRNDIYDFGLKEIKASIADTDVDSTFIHTENFFLIDSNYVVRGWYNGFDTLAMGRLAHDISALYLEKGKGSPSVFREFIPVLPLIFIGIAIVMVITYFLNKRRN